MIANLFGGDGLIVLVVALVVLVGGSQLPKIARNVGLAGKEFRKAQSEAEEEAAQQKEQKGQTAQAEVPAPSPPVALPTQAAGPASSEPVAAPADAAPTAPGDDSITLTPAQLDALLKAREQQVRNEAGTN